MNKQIVIFLIKNDEKILVEKRHQTSNWADELLFPGGNVEENETLELAMFRETMEELGIVPKEFTQIPTKERIYGFNKVIVNPFYISKYQGEVPTHILDKKNPLLWIDFKQALTSKIEPVKKAAEALKEYLKL
ncbi:NUDIX domain-containing protein [Candidatus Daviesbacteria bacterium]|nr:NUDIX domain-containing protein [Candidatus Daviesbacteria bacterium]